MKPRRHGESDHDFGRTVYGIVWTNHGAFGNLDDELGFVPMTIHKKAV